MKKILIISTFFPPDPSIASLRAYSFAKKWAKEGHQVSILTVKKEHKNKDQNYNLIEVPFPPYLNLLKKKYQHQTAPSGEAAVSKRSILKILLNKFDYFRQRYGIFSACRMPDFTDFWIHDAFLAAKAQGPWDLVISTAGPYSALIVGWKLKKQGFTKRWVADFRDYWSNSYVYPGLFPFSFFERWLEKKMMGAADIITTISAPLAEGLKAYHQKEVQVVENGFDPDDFIDLPEKIFPQDQKIRFVHTGTIYQGKRNIRPLFEALYQLRLEKENLERFEIIFVGVPSLEINQLIERFHLSHIVKYQGLIPRKQALAMQRDSEFLLFFPWNDEKIDGILTGKIFEYLYSGTHILAIGAQKIEASQELILKQQAGTILSDTHAVKSFLKTLLTEERVYQGSPKEGLELFERAVLAEKMLNLAS